MIEHVPPDPDDEREPYTLAQFSRDKGIAEERLRSYGVHTGVYYDGKPCVEIPYYGREGKEYSRVRMRLNGGKDGHRWNSGTASLIPYGLHRPVSYEKGFVIIPEGETDCFALWQYGFAALGLPGADSATCLRAEHLLGARKVYVVQEPDKGGSLFPGKVAAQCYREGYTGDVFAVLLPEGIKDARALMLDDPTRFTQRLQEAMLTAIRIEREVTRTLDLAPAAEAQKSPILQVIPGVPTVARNGKMGELPEPEWPPYQELPETKISAPILDEKLIPEPFRVYCVDAAERMGVYPETIAIPLIISACAVFGRRAMIRVKQNDNWFEHFTLWGMHVGHSAKKKSPAQKLALREINHLENAADATWQKNQADYAKRQKTEPDTEEIGEPKQRRYILRNVTYQTVGPIVANNPNGVLLYYDELSGLVAGMETEHQKGARQYYLQGWSGNEDGGWDRIGRGHGHVPHLALSIYGGIQPGPFTRHVNAALNEEGIEADGFLQRFGAMIFPDDKPPFTYEDREPDYDAADRVRKIFENLNAIEPLAVGAEVHPREKTDIPFFRFSPKAQEIFRAWYTAHEAHLEDEEVRRTPAFQAHLSKFSKLMVTLAGTFHVVSIADGGAIGPISTDAVALAAEVCSFFEAHARKVYRIGSTSPGRLLAHHIERGAVKDGNTIRAISRCSRKPLDKAEGVKAAITELAPLGWCQLQKVPRDNAKGGSPFTEIVRIHPERRDDEIYRG